MSSFADMAELIGFFSYSRDDDEDSHGALSALRERIQRELRGQLGRTMKSFRLWQDKEAISPGKLWEAELKVAVKQAVFFIPIITPTVVRSKYCRFELESFLAREAQLGRTDLVFPILYIRVPELEDKSLQRNDPVLSIIAKRQYLDWRELRHRDVNDSDVKAEVERFCAKICETLRQTSPSAEERRQAAALQRIDSEKKRREPEKKRLTGASKSMDTLEPAANRPGTGRMSGSFAIQPNNATAARATAFGMPTARLSMIAGGAALVAILMVWGAMTLFTKDAAQEVAAPAQAPAGTDQHGGPHRSALALPENNPGDPSLMIAPPRFYPGR